MSKPFPMRLYWLLWCYHQIRTYAVDGLRSLTSIEKELSNGNTDHALELLRELIEDTKKDIEA